MHGILNATTLRRQPDGAGNVVDITLRACPQVASPTRFGRTFKPSTNAEGARRWQARS
jgi:hypothetical protein